MSDMDMSRRGLLKTSLFGAAAAGMTGIAAAAEAKSSKKAPVYDAIVVGAGPAGLITAITAHDLGAKVVLFEKRDRPDGNAIYALGSVCGWGSRHQKEQGIEDTAEAFYAMMMDVSKQMGDKALNRTYTDNISEGIDWLEKEGVKFGKIKPMPYHVSAVPAECWAKVSRAAPASCRRFSLPPRSAALKSSTNTR